MKTHTHYFHGPSDASEYQTYIHAKGFQAVREEQPGATRVRATVDDETFEYLQGAEDYGPLPCDNSDMR